ncbi:MAG TPA: radical SAM protein [Anaeromyxobacteraceae bacterium]|nr:radical SAM protein [Anaeromyxobacteraceae bacterium]
MARLLFADDRGVVYDHPTLLAAVRTGGAALRPEERPASLPAGGALCLVTGRRPVGVHPRTGELVVMREARVGRRTFVPHAVGATLPPGYTRVFLPAGERPASGEAPVLPQWAYTAAGLGRDGPVAWAIRTDRRRHWDPPRRSPEEVRERVRSLVAVDANPVYRQLARCALEWSCFTAQNTFLGRDEGAIPASSACNARCVGCLSESQAGMPPSSHERIARGPSAEEMAEVGARHLATASGRTMVSFGQGCEGEPLVRSRDVARAIRLMRERTGRGSINLNTNGSMPGALAALAAAGLDAVRISLNSASPDLYEAYYRPSGYGLADVEESMRVAKGNGLYLALNLLVFPGVNDREGEVERLARLVARVGVDQVQTRSLAMDPDVYWEIAKDRGARGRPLGLRRLLAALRAARPGLSLGNFARGQGERRVLG